MEGIHSKGHQKRYSGQRQSEMSVGLEARNPDPDETAGMGTLSLPTKASFKCKRRKGRALHCACLDVEF